MVGESYCVILSIFTYQSRFLLRSRLFFVVSPFLTKFVFVCSGGRETCREEEFKDYAESFVLDIVGDNVCGVPVAKEVFLHPL
jgi:hypothetical protein